MSRVVIAARDITYPNKKGKAVVMWKKGAVVDDEDAAEAFVTYAKELVVVKGDVSRPALVKSKVKRVKKK